MAEKDDTAPTGRKLNLNVPAGTPTTQLEQAINAERARLLQVSCVLHCLYEVLLYAEGDDAITYAEAAHLAAQLIDESVERLDSVRLKPMIEAIRNAAAGNQGLTGAHGGYEVREPHVSYLN
jgi:hypothetical protein